MRAVASATRRIRVSALVSGALVYLSSNILNALIPFLLLPILTRYLTPAEYGKVAVFQAWTVGLSAVVGLSVAGAAGRKYFDLKSDEAAIARFLAACLHILVASAGVVACVTWLAQDAFTAWVGLEGEWLGCAVLLSAANCLVSLRLGQWQVRSRPLAYGALQFSSAICNAAASLFLVVTLSMGAEGRMLAQVAVACAFAVLAALLLRRDGLWRPYSWNKVYLREALDFGVPLIPHIAGAIVLSTIDRLFIQSNLGLAAVGIYMVAVQLAAGLGLIFDAVNNAYVPWLFERLGRRVDADRRQIVRNTYLWFAAIAVGGGLLSALGPQLVVLLAGPRYAEAAQVLGWLVLGQVFGGMYLMVANYVLFAKSTWLLSIVTVLAGLLNVALLGLLIEPYGMPGAAISFAVAMAVRFFLTWWVAHLRQPMPWFNFHG